MLRMDLEQEVIDWADDRGIFEKSTPLLQFSKTLEEVNELFDGIVQGEVDEIKDAIGDVMVTLIIQASMWGLSAEDCVHHAYKTICKRTGNVINGKFVKDV